MTPPALLDDDLRWQAFRYLADELDEDGRRRFEARLEADPDACAALAEAVELVASCLRLPTPSGLPKGSRSRAFPVVVGVLIAALVLAAMGIDQIIGLGPRERQERGTIEPGIAVERAWSHLQREVGPLDGLIDPAEGDWPEEETADPAWPAGEDGEDPEPPGWLLVAVKLDGGPDSPEPQPLEN
ncbi:hypothetical protein [Tautonia sociabilis]|uniref:Zf-HC2 domain-containing protein n=1 Tax=Tautonia sociabilis TaxID=2080755 RepID=A0A432MQN9_9BACT|nr:hypothetical protein [Tautonia sociabilis]RUL89366.1 hypothetical protein TsocGM_02860 [Tautonia sociabilis]